MSIFQISSFIWNEPCAYVDWNAGKESLVEWIDDPSYPNTTLSWNIIHGKIPGNFYLLFCYVLGSITYFINLCYTGTGKVEQEMLKSSTYYIAVGNLNSEEVEVDW